ncbi:MAG: hypothetical protein GY888_20830, partial [Planctomycetaceae bacterium]|nr:hypothetical protein [Planctomycetaceae bacterium]
MTDGNPTSIEVIPFGGKPLDAERLGNLLQRINSPVKIVLAANESLAQLLRATGEHATPQVHVLDDEAGIWGCVGQMAARGAQHASRLVAPSVPLKNPRKPLSQGPLVPWAVAIMILVVAVICGEGLIEQKLDPVRDQLAIHTDEHIALDERIEQYSEWDFAIEQEMERRDALLAQVLPVEARNDLIENV